MVKNCEQLISLFIKSLNQSNLYSLQNIFQIKGILMNLLLNGIDNLNTAFMRPVFSPRSQMSIYMNDIEKNKTSLVINIDKETLALLKNQFQNYDNKIDKISFISIGQRILKSWQKDLQHRQSRMIVYLLSLFNQIENKQQGICISWEQFNNLIIQKALNLKSLQTHDNQSVSQLKHVAWSKRKIKLLSPIQKVVCLNKQKKIAYLCEQSNKIQFLNMFSNHHSFKPIILQKQDLMVQKTLVKRVKNQASRAVVKQNYKKDVVVSGYKVTFLDMIYVCTQKYEMLITSSTDCLIRGWDVHGSLPTLAKQPENQQQKMIHQFPAQIYSMAWDDVNDVLYCSAKNSKIYIWVVKTDSQKQLSDPDGHKSMISAMIMMPKLQFLATGDEQGKLILWDTISMNKKYKYEQHTRSIVSITFHQALILLFTASFDHSICVWNPYIPSLIYKISCNLNVVQVQIIPGTNYLAALDIASNLKIRQINKFNLISNFVVDRPDDSEVNKSDDLNQGSHKIEPTCMAVSYDPVRFYFAGEGIKCLQFDQNQALTSSQYFPSVVKYHQQKMKLYIVIKTSILVWDMLTGQLHDILMAQSQSQITTMDLIQDSARFVIGDSEGSVYIRKLENGIKICKLYKHKLKASTDFLITKKGGIWNQSIIISCFHDGEIAVFGKDQSHDFGLLRCFNIRKNYPNTHIVAIQYQQKRNILFIATVSGDIIFYDVDKSRVTNQIQAKGLQALKIVIKSQIPNMLAFGKNSQIFGIYLPPHSKKFKISCNLLIHNKVDQKITAVAACKKSNECFLGYQTGAICRIILNQKSINNETESSNQIKKIDVDWQIKFAQIAKDMILIIDQTILVVILYTKNITLISTKNGQILNSLPSYAFNSQHSFYQNPLFYYTNNSQKQMQKSDVKSQHQLYLPKQRKYISLDSSIKDDKKNINIFHNPFFLSEEYYRIVTSKDSKDKQSQIQKQNNDKKNEIWNKTWKVFPKFKDLVNHGLQQLLKINKQISQVSLKSQKRQQRNNSMSVTKNIQKAIDAKHKWQKLKQQFEDDQSKIKINNSSSWYNLNKLQQIKNNNAKNDIQLQRKQQPLIQRLKIKHNSLYKSESSPFIRLGIALKKINNQDQKASKFIQLGSNIHNQQIKTLKFPNINKKISNE